MEFIGGIEGMKFTPISNYNNYLKDNTAFDVNSSTDFENILNNQKAALKDSFKIDGGIEVNNVNDLMISESSQASFDKAPGSNFMKNFSNSINSGLTSVNNNIEAADKAQESFAMGEDVSVHDVMIASEKAALSLQMAMQIRNKLISAYSEINNIRV